MEISFDIDSYQLSNIIKDRARNNGIILTDVRCMPTATGVKVTCKVTDIHDKKKQIYKATWRDAILQGFGNLIDFFPEE